MKVFTDINQKLRDDWLVSTLSRLEPGAKILDAGAGNLKNKKHCGHLQYVSQDFCQYQSDSTASVFEGGLHTPDWGIHRVDLVCDITAIPLSDKEFDVILCSEVLEHLPDPMAALDEMTRLLKEDGLLILTTPFASMVHMAPFYFYSGFSKYWFEYHLTRRGLTIEELTPNGDWFALLRQEVRRLGYIERSLKNWSWPLAYLYGLLGAIYFAIRKKHVLYELATLGWHCVARKASVRSSH